jgi:hypothetical protein
MTRTKAGEARDARSGLPLTAAQYTWRAMASERQREIRRRRKRKKERGKVRDRDRAKEVRKVRAARKGKG